MSWKERHAKAIKDLEGKPKGTHAWFIFREEDGLRCCANCGIIERRDGKNNPCPGKVKVTLRGQKIES